MAEAEAKPSDATSVAATVIALFAGDYDVFAADAIVVGYVVVGHL